MIRYTLTWNLQPTRDEGLSHIRMRVSWNSYRNVTSFLLGFRVSQSKWNAESRRVKANTFHDVTRVPAYAINKRMDEFENHVHEIMVSSVSLTTDEFRERFSMLINDINDDNSLHSILDRWVEEKTSVGNLSVNSARMYKRVAGVIKRLYDCGRIKCIDENILIHVSKYYIDKGNRNSSLRGVLIIVSMIVKWCNENGYTKIERLKKVKLKGNSSYKKLVWLTWDELMSVYNMDIPYGKAYKQDVVRDIFCFMCLTSLRYSDARFLKWVDVSDDSISITISKTSERVVIELNYYAKSIIDKYKGYDEVHVFPHTEIKTMNTNIRIIAEQAGIVQPVNDVWYCGGVRKEGVVRKCDVVSCHTGRHTFIVNALSIGIPPQIVMKWTGHSSYKSMQPYIDVVDSAKKQSMKLFDKLPSNNDSVG